MAIEGGEGAMRGRGGTSGCWLLWTLRGGMGESGEDDEGLGEKMGGWEAVIMGRGWVREVDDLYSVIEVVLVRRSISSWTREISELQLRGCFIP